MQVTHKNGLETNNSQPVSIGQLWSKFMAYRPLFLLLTGLALLGAWLYLSYTTPLYESTANILIKDEKKGAEESKVLESLNVLSVKKIIENEIEIIQSRTLIGDVVNNLCLYAPTFTESKLKATSAYLTSPVKIEVRNPDELEETGKINFSFDSSNAKVLVGDHPYPLNEWVTTPYGTLKFSPNKRYNHYPEGRLSFSLVNPKKIVQGIQDKLVVALASKPSTILNLKLKDQVPQRGEDILNELMVVYNNAVIRDKNTLASNTLSFVDERLKSVAHDLDSIEHRIQQYKSNSGAIDISTQGRLFLENVSANDQKLSELNMQLAVLNQVESYVRSKNTAGARIVPSTLGIDDTVLSDLLSKLYESELEFEKLKNTEAENAPSLVAVANQIEKIKPTIIENIEGQRRSLEASRSNLSSTNSKYSSALQDIPQKEREILDINRSQSIKTDLYNFLLQKREEASLSYASTVPDSRVVDKAESSLLPVSPNSRLVYLIALALAIGAGIAVVTLKETFNSKILFRHEIESMASYPVIGEIAFEKSNAQFVIGEGKKTFIAEQFRKLRLAIDFLKTKHKKKIVVTSTIAGEGKSFVASNLALSLALTGKKVILLELDLNHPALIERLGMFKEKTGIVSYLEGKNEPEEIIKRTEAHENLFFIPAGPLPNNSTELLMNGKLKNLLSFLEGIFDYIIIDTAPVSPVTDAYIVSSFCDITLYVIRHNYTPKVFVERLEANNKISQLNNPMIIFNGIRPRGFNKNNYGYKYGYGYVFKEKNVLTK